MAVFSLLHLTESLDWSSVIGNLPFPTDHSVLPFTLRWLHRMLLNYEALSALETLWKPPSLQIRDKFRQWELHQIDLGAETSSLNPSPVLLSVVHKLVRH